MSDVANSDLYLTVGHWASLTCCMETCLGSCDVRISMRQELFTDDSAKEYAQKEGLLDEQVSDLGLDIAFVK